MFRFMRTYVCLWKKRIRMSGPEKAVLADVSQYPHVLSFLCTLLPLLESFDLQVVTLKFKLAFSFFSGKEGHLGKRKASATENVC